MSKGLNLFFVMVYVLFIVVALYIYSSVVKSRSVDEDYLDSIFPPETKTDTVNGDLTETSKFTVLTAKGILPWLPINKEVFLPVKLLVEELTSPIPTLIYRYEPSCKKEFKSWQSVLKTNVSHTVLEEFSENKENNMKGFAIFTKDCPTDTVDDGKPNESEGIDGKNGDSTITITYPKGGLAMQHAMNFYGVRNSSGLVVGTQNSLIKTSAIKAGASKILAVVSPKVGSTETEQVTNVHENHLAENWESYGPFDFAASFFPSEVSERNSSMSNPDFDVREMQRLRCLLKPNGLLFLSLPRGQDVLCSNGLRIYGRIRLAILFAGFRLVHVFRDEQSTPVETKLSDYENKTSIARDTFVLRKVKNA